HSRIYQHARILHGDISNNNVLFYKTEEYPYVRGLLIDFDHAIDFSDGKQINRQCGSGTLPFMSINNLADDVDLVSALDDWESVIYLICWVGTYGFDSSLTYHPDILDKLHIRRWRKGPLDDIIDAKRTSLISQQSLYVITYQFMSILPSIELLDELVHEV
ncbi:hypothetical protein GGI07_005009, partial [Coemansia sp. Benny D115]